MKYKKLLTNFSKPSNTTSSSSSRFLLKQKQLEVVLLGKKTIFAQILLLAVLLGIIFLFKLSFNLSNNPTNSSNLASLFINFETEKRSFEGEVVDDMTMLDALNAAVSVGKIKLNYAIDESGNVNIMEIDGHTNGVNNKYFVFYLNSKKISPETLNKEKISHGDSIEIRNE